ncbi:MAG: hypothetical protein KDC34_14705 [Saprospiraceae bacterium]|nr:hypothetical protein [Saprospiraceae bacterium]
MEPKLKYSSDYLRGLIHSKRQDLYVDLDTLVYPDGSPFDPDEYHVTGLAFTRKPNRTDQFSIWKVLYRTPADVFTIDPQTDMLFLEVQPPSGNPNQINPPPNTPVSWWISDIVLNNQTCLNVRRRGISEVSFSINDLDIDSSFDFAYFDAMSLSMQCQNSEGVFISGAMVVLEHLYFRLIPYGQTRTLKAERVMTGADTACIDDAAIVEGNGGLRASSQTVYTENAPHVLLGVPCPPFWGIMGELAPGDEILERTIQTGISEAAVIPGPVAAAVINYNGASLKIAYGFFQFFSAIFGLFSKQFSALFKQTFITYFRTRVIIKSGKGKSYLAEVSENRFKTGMVGAERLRQILDPKNEIKDQYFFVNSSQTLDDF